MKHHSLTVASVISRFFPGYRCTRRLRFDVQRAAASIIRCGTAACGAHVQRCPCGHINRISYNSCRHRSCPRCSGGRRAKWLEQTASELLPCDHVHVIFTVPAELNVLWRFNRHRFANLLLKAAKESLLGLLADPKYLGAQPGVISALHTWGSNLSIHPHVHCLVSAGGLTGNGDFIQQQRHTLLPARVLMAVFRGRMLHLLRLALISGELKLPPDERPARISSRLNRLGRIAWNVRVQERYGQGVAVAGYLARYISGGPIADRRLVSVSAKKIVFRYRDYRTHSERLQKLEPGQFLERWFEHVPPRGLRTIRRSGLYANCYRKLRESLREQAFQERGEPSGANITPVEPTLCPQCHEPVVRIEFIRPGRDPERLGPTWKSIPLGQPP